MSDNPIPDTNAEEPVQTPISAEPESIEPPDEINDPLYRLRLSLLDEEAKEADQPKPAGFLHRVSEGLKGKRPQPKPKEEEESPTARFGVQTAFEPLFPEPVSKRKQAKEDQPEELQDEFLEKRLGTGPLNQEWRRLAAPSESTTKDETAENHAEASEYLSGTRAATERIQSQFSTNLTRSSSLNWEDGDQGATAGEKIDSSPVGMVSPEPTRAESSFSYFSEERKALPASTEKVTQPGPFIVYQPKTTLAQRFRAMTPLEKILIIVLVASILTVGGMIGIFYYQSQIVPAAPEPAVIVQPTVTPAGVPIPVDIRLPGGWNFPLRRSTMVKGKWVPASSEWLEGTEIRRVVGIPWNKQTEAVIQTLAANDKIELVMNNGDILNYKVQSVGQVAAQDTSILYDTKPSLLIVLINPDTENRWVVIAYP